MKQVIKGPFTILKSRNKQTVGMFHFSTGELIVVLANAIIFTGKKVNKKKKVISFTIPVPMHLPYLKVYELRWSCKKGKYKLSYSINDKTVHLLEDTKSLSKAVTDRIGKYIQYIKDNGDSVYADKVQPTTHACAYLIPVPTYQLVNRVIKTITYVYWQNGITVYYLGYINKGENDG